MWIKKSVLLFFWCLIISNHINAQTVSTEKIKVAFDVSSADTKIHEAVIRHIKGVLAKYPNASITVVAYGNGLSMVQKNTSTIAPYIKDLASKNISFNVCRITLSNRRVDPSAILEDVTIVPDGIVYLIDLQRQGYAYIKEME